MEVDAVWVADLLGESSHLVGHSYGGCIALAAAARRPHAVKSLTLIEAPIFAAADDDAIVGKFRAQHAEIRSGNYSPIERLIKFGEMVNIPTALLASTGTAPTADELERMGEGIASMRLPTDWDAGPALKAVVDALTPVLAITGGWSPAFAAIADGIAAKTSGKHVVVQAGHHFPQLVDPFNEVLATFLTI
jgi:pimeloyl-ACP methyl ester carboxylesterase